MVVGKPNDIPLGVKCAGDCFSVCGFERVGNRASGSCCFVKSGTTSVCPLQIAAGQEPSRSVFVNMPANTTIGFFRAVPADVHVTVVVSSASCYPSESKFRHLHHDGSGVPEFAGNQFRRAKHSLGNYAQQLRRGGDAHNRQNFPRAPGIGIDVILSGIHSTNSCFFFGTRLEKSYFVLGIHSTRGFLFGNRYLSTRVVFAQGINSRNLRTTVAIRSP